LGSPIAEVEEVNILAPNEEQSPCTPKTNSLSQFQAIFFHPSISISFHFVGLAYQDKDFVFRLIIEYNNLMDFAPLVGLI
jgi:hypothetical protein